MSLPCHGSCMWLCVRNSYSPTSVRKVDKALLCLDPCALSLSTHRDVAVGVIDRGPGVGLGFPIFFALEDNAVPTQFGVGV